MRAGQVYKNIQSDKAIIGDANKAHSKKKGERNLYNNPLRITIHSAYLKPVVNTTDGNVL